MPYILLALGCLIGLYALYRFFLKANVRQIKALFLSSIFIVLCAALFFMAITGRLAEAIALVVALTPVIHAMIKEWRERPNAKPNGNSEIQSRKDALEVLGLPEDASEDDIQQAYKKLMQKIHPDAEGSEWMAAKLNEARDFLRKD